MNLKEERLKELFDLEMSFDGRNFIGQKTYNIDFNVHYTEILCDTDEEWRHKIDQLRIKLKERKIKEENNEI